MKDIAAELRNWDRTGERIALATVIETWGSSPRPLGAKLAVTGSGKMAGSVSNGCIEGAVFEVAQKVLETGVPTVAAFGVADDLAFEVGLACGGHIEVFVQPFTDVHREALDRIQSDRWAVLTTDLKTGEVELSGEQTDVEAARREGDRFIEPLVRQPHLILIGGIHIAVPLHRMAKIMGYRVTVIDARGQFATRERFPEADAIVVRWPDEALAEIDLDLSTYVVILTHDPKFDLPSLRAVLGRQVRYLGAIGSRKTHANRLAELRAEGYPDAQLATIHAPIGLDLGGRGAEETALAILAEMTAVRYQGSGGFRSAPA